MLRHAQHEKVCNRRDKKIRRGVMGITAEAADRLYVESIGNISRTETAGEEPPDVPSDPIEYHRSHCRPATGRRRGGAIQLPLTVP
jgi:hypothetical protein